MSGRDAGRSVRPRISWHRGGAEIAPFATLSAFSSAAAHGAELIEVDLRRTGDGMLVCVHDAVLPGLGRIDGLAWAEIGDREVGEGRVFGFETFLDVLDASDPERRCEIHLDLKEAGYEAEAVAAVLGRSRRVSVTTSVDESIAAVRGSHPSVPALLTLGREWRGLGTVDRLTMWSGDVFPFSRINQCGATGVAAHHALAGPILRRWLTRRGMDLVVWTVDDDRSLRRWLAHSDVDVVTTNRPLAALAIREQLEAR
ncbi:MAG: glycerophosphodiester phosphodiesterase [Acidimicrobiales bacterium]